MHVYHTDGQKNQTVSRQFATGAGAEYVHVREGYQGGPVAVYGWTRGLWAIVESAKAAGEPWWYIDNGYFMRGAFFRVTREALQWQGFGTGVAPSGAARLHELDIDWQEWRHGGEHIVIAQQSAEWYGFAGEGSREAWTARTVAELQQRTSREIQVRPKTERSPFGASLAGAWAVVTHSSNCAVDAVVAGVPSFVTGESAAAPMCRRDLSMIERPMRFEDRLRWAAHLAANQWDLEEMRSGRCWHDLSP